MAFTCCRDANNSIKILTLKKNLIILKGNVRAIEAENYRAAFFAVFFTVFFGAGFLATFSQQLPVATGSSLPGFVRSMGALRHQLCVLVSYSGLSHAHKTVQLNAV